MGKGKGGAVMAIVVICQLAAALQCAADAHVVGDSAGWNMNISGWGKNVRFLAGDTILFRYPKGKHNVVVLDMMACGRCYTNHGDKVYTSGDDIFTLKLGPTCFICSFPGHCPNMSLQIFATKQTQKE
ncbi:hypothetical protein M8C21_012302 [Ambrosia artemisiifolia]|uniref:Phytocyanin domain-containing protein n=1 Tax=Ambrosia artemisiifolia TaxID=4212 RepID=A0AAD5GCH0_AMBAR|nr:hypothetical protein M8C21_012302 [Ambrosia artemisiifolia]